MISRPFATSERLRFKKWHKSHFLIDDRHSGGHLYRPNKRKIRLTVCVAAICKHKNYPMIVGASDRMITAGDIEFEPPKPKIYEFPGIPCVALLAGDSSAQSEICARTLADLVEQKVHDGVRRVAETFGRQVATFRREQAERQILFPLGLDSTTFIDRQKDMLPEFVEATSNELIRHEIGIQAIITGADRGREGAHIYVVNDDGFPVSYDASGFAAIGIGERHAESEFMFARYTNSWTYARAVFLVYAAKKRAEVAPGVGVETDMFVVSPGGHYYPIHEAIADEISRTYEEMIRLHKGISNTAIQNAEEFVSQILETVSTPTPTPQSTQPPKPPPTPTPTPVPSQT